MARKHTLVVVGFAMLLLSAYLDNLRGTLLAVLAQEFSLTYTRVGFLLVGGYACSIIATYALIPWIRARGLRTTAIGVSLLAVLPAGVAAIARAYSALLGMSGVLGAAVSTTGALANVLVVEGSPEATRARNLCGLHMMYGLGSLFGPLLAGRSVDAGIHWAWLLALPVPFALGLAGYARRVLSVDPPSPETLEAEPLDVEAPAGDPFPPAARIWVVLFCIYVVGEVVTTVWLPTYLVQTLEFSVGHASLYVSGFFFAMLVSRALGFLSVFSRDEASERRWIERCTWWGLGTFALGRAGYPWAFALTGLVGPFFPLLVNQLGRRFPTQSRRVVLATLVAMQVVLAASHFTIGRVSDSFGIGVGYWTPAIAFFVSAVIWRRLQIVVNS